MFEYILLSLIALTLTCTLPATPTMVTPMIDWWLADKV